jgi:hypothetical protein
MVQVIECLPRICETLGVHTHTHTYTHIHTHTHTHTGERKCLSRMIKKDVTVTTS